MSTELVPLQPRPQANQPQADIQSIGYANPHGSGARQAPSAAAASDAAMVDDAEPAAKVAKMAGTKPTKPATKAKAKAEARDKFAMLTRRVIAVEQAHDQLAAKVEAGGKLTTQLDIFEGYLHNKTETHNKELMALETLFRETIVTLGTSPGEAEHSGGDLWALRQGFERAPGAGPCSNG